MDVAQVRALAAEMDTTLSLTAELVGAVRASGSASSEAVRSLATRLAARPALSELPAMILRAHAEITDILSGIRLTREAIQAHTVDRIRDTKDRLNDVSATTESATLELMNGLDRSTELINSLETQAKGQADSGGFAALRAQVSALYNHLQFQDITAQQLQGVTASLLDIELRMTSVSALLDHGVLAASSALPRPVREPESSAGLAYNPDATMHHSRADQAMIDATFQGARRATPASPAAG
jgi:chemotaxis regulatin CheY-phosphate phosphatase CheZ